MLQQDFHRGNNPAYDRVAFVAEHYEELVFMYKDILEHLKQGGGGGGCTHISKQVESPYGFVQLDKESFKLIGYDLDNPDDIQFLLHNTTVNCSSKIGISGPYSDYYAYKTSNGIEYYDTYEVDTGNIDTFLIRDPVLDNLLDDPSKNFSYITIKNSYIGSKTIYKGDLSDKYQDSKDEILRAMYLKVLNQINGSGYITNIQGYAMTLELYGERDYKDVALYTKTSDSVENNPLYVGKSPSKIITYNNVLVYPINRYGTYGNSSTLAVKPLLPPLREGYGITVSDIGDTVSCRKSWNGDIYLRADLPEIDTLGGEHTGTHTFTITIDPDIKDDY